MMSELFPTNLRAKAVSITTTTLWIFIFSGVYLFPSITGAAQEHFLTARKVQVFGKTISFVESDPAHIENPAGDFEKAGFRPLDQVTVLGATANGNNGTFLIAEVTPHQLILGQSAQLTAEAAGAEVTLQIGSVGPPFWLFSGICILSLLFGLTIMPETKGRTLEEIGTSWKKRENIRN